MAKPLKIKLYDSNELLYSIHNENNCIEDSDPSNNSFYAFLQAISNIKYKRYIKLSLAFYKKIKNLLSLDGKYNLSFMKDFVLDGYVYHIPNTDYENHIQSLIQIKFNFGDGITISQSSTLQTTIIDPAYKGEGYISYSIENSPTGLSVDSNGLITADANAEIGTHTLNVLFSLTDDPSTELSSASMTFTVE